jgi:replicative DNA helicase
MLPEERQKAAKKEKNKLNKIFKDVISAEDFKKIDGLIENAAFLRVSLTELQMEIQEKGYVEEYQNGENQYGTKESCYVRAYNNLVKSYNTTMKQLMDFAPDADVKEDPFDAFTARRTAKGKCG